MHKTSVFLLPILALSLSLGACGTTKGERAASGAAIGGAAGAAGAAATGGNPLGGAVLGGAAGAATGAITDEEDVNLGDPVWKDDDDEDEKD